MRISVSLQVCVKPALLDVFHNRNNDPSYGTIPDNEAALYQVLYNFKVQNQNKFKNIIRPSQWDIMCPVSGKSCSNDLDITSTVFLIINLANLPPPNGGWKQLLPQPGDNSKAANCLLARQLRNEINHCDVNKIATEADFNVYWARVRSILVGLGYNDIALFDQLKTASLDQYTKQKISAISDRIASLSEKIDDINDNAIRKSKVNFNEISILKADIAALENRRQADINEMDKRILFFEETLEVPAKKQKISLEKIDCNAADIVELKKVATDNKSEIENIKAYSKQQDEKLDANVEEINNWKDEVLRSIEHDKSCEQRKHIEGKLSQI